MVVFVDVHIDGDLDGTVGPRPVHVAVAVAVKAHDHVADDVEVVIGYGPQTVSSKIAQTSYGSAFAAGRRSSK